MGHIHDAPGQHDLTISAFIVDISGPKPRIWLHKHKILGKWLQFGGHVELDENPWQAICRELAEEVGFEMAQLKVLQPKFRLRLSTKAQPIPQPISLNTHLYPAAQSVDHFHTDIEIAFITNQQPLHKPAEGESKDIRLFTAAELRAMGEEILTDVREISLFVIERLLDEWEPVDCGEFNR